MVYFAFYQGAFYVPKTIWGNLRSPRRIVDRATPETTLASGSCRIPCQFFRILNMARRRKSTVRKSLRRKSKRPKLQASRRARVKKTKKHRYVYYFGDGQADGSGGMKSLLGGKGANLHEMTRIGLPVPPGFTITTEVCTHF